MIDPSGASGFVLGFFWLLIISFANVCCWFFFLALKEILPKMHSVLTVCDSQIPKLLKASSRASSYQPKKNCCLLPSKWQKRAWKMIRCSILAFFQTGITTGISLLGKLYSSFQNWEFCWKQQIAEKRKIDPVLLILHDLKILNVP